MKRKTGKLLGCLCMLAMVFGLLQGMSLAALAEDTAVTSVGIEPTSITLTAGDSTTLEAAVHPFSATDQTVIWESSNTKVAAVDEDGVVSALSVGTATITVTATNGTEDPGDDKTATCKVTVHTPNDEQTPLTFEAAGSLVTVKIDNVSGFTYRKNGDDPASYTGSITLRKGERLQIYGSGTRGPRFKITGDCYVFGNVMSLLDGDSFSTANTVGTSAFDSLFSGNDSLRNHPIRNLVLPAQNLGSYCYGSMFRRCTSLTRAPVLPATTLAFGCYARMFDGCTSLTQAPALPAGNLAEYCYNSMFEGCTSLIHAPVLPAATLKEGCYYDMFYGCTSLTQAPLLPATTLAVGCYYEMFSGCSSLRSVACLATDVTAEVATTNWLAGVASGGTFFKASGMNGWATGNPSGIPAGWTVQGPPVAVTGVTLDRSTATFHVGESIELNASFEPSDATDRSVIWSVEGTNADAVKLYADSACTIEISGDATEILKIYVMGISEGSATIVATSNADSMKTVNCDVTVEKSVASYAVSINSIENAWIQAAAVREGEISEIETATPGEPVWIYIEAPSIPTGKYYMPTSTASVEFVKDYDLRKWHFMMPASDLTISAELADQIRKEYDLTLNENNPEMEREVFVQFDNNNAKGYYTWMNRGTVFPFLYDFNNDNQADISIHRDTTGGEERFFVRREEGADSLSQRIYSITYPGLKYSPMVFQLAQKYELNLEVSLAEWTYGEPANTPMITGNLGQGTVTYAYKVRGADDSTYTEVLPVNAGEYTVKATVEETEDYKGGTATADFTIAKARITPTVTIDDWTFGEAESGLDISGNDGKGDWTVSYAKRGSKEYSATVPTAAGKYTVKVEIAATDNYTAGIATANFTIAKVSIQPTVTIDDWTYGEAPSGFVISGNPGKGDWTVSYAEQGSNEYAATVPTAAGKYTLKVEIAATENYTAGTATANFTIAKVKINPTVIIDDWTYGEAPSGVNIRGNAGDGDWTVTYAEQGSVNYSATVPTAAGKYTVKVEIAATDNYTAGTATANFTIAKVSINPTVTIDDWTYGEAPSGVVIRGNEDNGNWTIRYAEQGSAKYTDTVPTAAGKYTVRVAIAATDNYAAGTATANFTIAKASIDPTVVISSWDYGETASTPSVIGNPGEGAVTYTYAARGSSEFSDAVPDRAGEYTVKAVIAETANYLGGEATAEFTVYSPELPEADFETPGALQTIEAEAFEGIGAVHVRIADNVTSIGSRAFANCLKLQTIYIPDSVKTIPNDLLEGCGEVTVYGSSNTVRRFAEANGFTYVEVP